MNQAGLTGIGSRYKPETDRTRNEVDLKPAILLAAHGTTDPEAGKDLEAVTIRVRKRFPGLETVWAYTSSFVRRRLGEKGVPVASPPEALAGLAARGFGRIAVQSFHVVAGYDFEEFSHFRNDLDLPVDISVGRPLLDSSKDVERVARALLDGLPTERTPDQAVVFMGHGTGHPAGSAYLALALALARLDSNIFLGCLDSGSGIRDIRESILGRQIKKVWLLPFLALAGTHTKSDLAGPEPDSWASVLNAAGVDCHPVLKGLCRNAGVADIWLDHLEATLKEL